MSLGRDVWRIRIGEVTIAYTIRPSDWDERLWGIYSNNKYMFMMDNLGKIYAETEQTKEVRVRSVLSMRLIRRLVIRL